MKITGINTLWIKREQRLVERADLLLSEFPFAKKFFFVNVAWFSDKNNQKALLAQGSDITVRMDDKKTHLIRPS
ncbi:MAG: hypothetical protein OSB68_08325 [Dehalococcoidia bacterium]|nr:hypothetical protein [Dehalococcoidia bacterium]